MRDRTHKNVQEQRRHSSYRQESTSRYEDQANYLVGGKRRHGVGEGGGRRGERHPDGDGTCKSLG